MRTRATVLQAHTHQWLATVGNPGDGEYRAELRQAVAAIQSHLKAHHHPEVRALLRLDGQYGTGAILSELAGLAYVMRGKDYQLLKRTEVQARLRLPPAQYLTHPESGNVRALYIHATVASPTSGHEAALDLKYWVWFYSIRHVLFCYRMKKQRKELGEIRLVFSKLVWYIFLYRTYVFGSILN